MADEFVWMRHGETGGVQSLPAGAREAWERLGWVECEAPVEPDPTMAEHVPLTQALAEQRAAEPTPSPVEESPTTSNESEE